MKKKSILFASLFWAILLVNSTNVIDIYSGNDIQSGIDSALNGDIVHVHAGNYDVNELSWSGKHIQLITDSQSPAVITGYNALILDGEDINNSDLISGFTFINCSGRSGSAIQLLNGASPKIVNCIFDTNEAGWGDQEGGSLGGAVLIQGSSIQTNIPWFHNCLFENNNSSSTGGGAIALCGGAKLTNSTFKSNHCDYCVSNSEDGGDLRVEYPNCICDGGAILIHNVVSSKDIIIDNCTFENNRTCMGTNNIASYKMEMLNSLQITNCEFILSEQRGESISLNKERNIISNQNYADIIIKNNLFKSSSLTKCGQGIYITDYGFSDITITNNIFDHLFNRCLTINYRGGVPSNLDYLTFNNNTMTDVLRTAVKIINGAYYTFNNNIFNRCSYGINWYDASSQFTTESLTLNNNLFYHTASTAIYYDDPNNSEHPLVTNNNIFNRDPLLDSNYSPRWTTNEKSPCIEAGNKDLDNDGKWWFEDLDDQDIYGTRQEIGAVSAEVFASGRILKKDKVNWVCFPYSADEYEGVELPTLRHFLSDITEANDFLRAEWAYDNNNYYNSILNTLQTEVFGQKGFKIEVDSDIRIDNFGFQVGDPRHYDSGSTIILTKEQSEDEGANLIGYYRTESCHPMDAFADLLDYSIVKEIKGEDWCISYRLVKSVNKSGGITLPQYEWYYMSYMSAGGGAASLDFGEAVEVVYQGDSEFIEFTWSDGLIPVDERSTVKAKSFDYNETPDYLPLQVNLTDVMTSKTCKKIVEVGFFVNGQCKGAGVTNDSLVTIFAYLDGEAINENDVVSFEIHEADSKNGNRSVNQFVVVNQDNIISQIGSCLFFELKQGDQNGSQESNVEMVSGFTSIYPNPFNPETTIEYNLAKDMNVKLSIFNLKGQLVKRLVDDKLSAGNHKVVWSGTNNNGNIVSSGIYFCKFKSENTNSMRKIILMK